MIDDVVSGARKGLDSHSPLVYFTQLVKMLILDYQTVSNKTQ